MDYWNMYKDVWNFHKKYSEVKTSEAYWNAVIEESDQIAKRYDNTKFIRDLLMSVIMELERIYKEVLEIAEAQ